MVIAPTVEDTALYECVVSNEAGEDSRFINLTVHGEKSCSHRHIISTTLCQFLIWLVYMHLLPSVPLVPPSIADEPTELVVTRLSPVVIACTASGVPEPTIVWSKDGMKLPQEGQGYSVLPTGQNHIHTNYL